MSGILFYFTHYPCIHHLYEPSPPSPHVWIPILFNFLFHTPTHPPTTPPLYYFLSLSGLVNTTYITLPFVLYLFSYPMSDFFYRTTYRSSSPDISSNSIFSRILIPDVVLVRVLQNHIITLINIHVPQLLLVKLLLLLLIHILLHHLLMHFNDLIHTLIPQNRYGFPGEETDNQPVWW